MQNIPARQTRCSTGPGLEQDEIRRSPRLMEQGGRLVAKAKVTDAILDAQADCSGTWRLHRGDRGVPRVRLHPRHAWLWGDRRHDQIRLGGERSFPMSATIRSSGQARRVGVAGDRHPELHRL
jgi:hypothetical protein